MIIGNPVLTGGSVACVLTITTSPGANVTAVLDKQTVAATANDSGIAVLRLRKEGTWTITASNGDSTKSVTVEVSNKKAADLTLFPSEPTSYVLIDTYTEEQTWTAPEDGYYEIELQGASGKGGKGATNQKRDTAKDEVTFYAYSGGSGGGGGCAISRVKMNKGDTIVLAPGAVGSVSKATINSSLETYEVMQVTAAGNGGNATTSAAGSAGSGGTASGGNYAIYAGGAGKKGNSKTDARVLSVLEDNLMSITVTASSPAGGTAGCDGGNAGGKGGSATVGSTAGSYSPSLGSPGVGSAGFVKIYRGDTNVVA